MGLLRKGNGMFRRFHDYNLADEVFRTLHVAHDAERQGVALQDGTPLD